MFDSCHIHIDGSIDNEMMNTYEKISKVVTEYFQEYYPYIKEISILVQEPEVYHGITFYFSPKVNVYTHGLNFVNQFEIIDFIWKYCNIHVSLNDILIIPHDSELIVLPEFEEFFVS